MRSPSSSKGAGRTRPPGHDHSRSQPGMREGGPLGVLAEGGVTPSSILPAGRALLTPRLPREAALGANPCALRAGAGETQARAVGMRTGPSAARRAAAPARGDPAPTRGDPRPLSWSNNLLLEMLSPELIGACAAPPTPATLGTFQCPNAPRQGAPGRPGLSPKVGALWGTDHFFHETQDITGVSSEWRLGFQTQTVLRTPGPAAERAAI